MNDLLPNLAHPEAWVVLDTETTGRGPNDEIIEIAIVSGNGEVLLDRTVCPTVPIPPACTRIHGLTPGALEDAPRFPAIYEDLSSLLRNQIVLSYSAAFDRRMLLATCGRYRLPPIPADWLCVLELFESMRGFRPPLHIACEIEGLSSGYPRHRAAIDAQMTWALAKQLSAERLDH